MTEGFFFAEQIHRGASEKSRRHKPLQCRRAQPDGRPERSLTSFNLFVEDDGTNGNRSASEFKLFAGGQLVDDVPILNTFGNESYDGVYGSNYIDISDSLAGLPISSNYTLELIQNQGPGGSSGVRALDFEASGKSSVPEPASMAGVLISAIGLCARRRRV